MNFATVKGLTIPEGNVTKITDVRGRVLWSAAKMATVKLKAMGDSNGYAWTIIDGVRYEGTEEVTVPSGTVITCYAKLSPSIVPKFNNPCYISVNGTRVADTQYEETISHTFTVNADATITMYTDEDYDDRDTKYQYGYIAIVAVPEGYAFVQVAGNGNGNVYVTIDGQVYTGQAALVVPIGTVMVCHATHPTSTPKIMLNSEVVSSSSYEHIITTSTSVAIIYMYMPTQPANTSFNVANIVITEQ